MHLDKKLAGSANASTEEEPPVKSIFSLMYDTDGKPLNQEAKQIQRLIEDEYEEFKQRVPVPVAIPSKSPKSPKVNQERT